MLSYDPLPPADSVDLYSHEKQRGGGWRTAGEAAAADEGNLALFFRSMMPNFDPSAPAPQAAEGDDA